MTERWRLGVSTGAAVALAVVAPALLRDLVVAPAAIGPVAAAFGAVLAMAAVVAGATRRRHREPRGPSAERLLADRLREVEMLRSELVTTVCHELRTPLTPVRGYAEMLLRGWERFDDRQRSDLLRRIIDHTDEIAGVLEGFVEFADLEGSLDALRPESLHLATAVEEHATELVRVHGRSLEVDVDRHLWVVADRSALRAVVSHLLDNAAAYSPDGTAVTMRARRAGDWVVAAVVDSGPGIPAEVRSLAFEPFYRHRGPALARRGAGIGLATVRAYVGRLGGRTWVEDAPGGGAAVCFTVPLGTPGATRPRRRVTRSGRAGERGAPVMARSGTPRP